MLRLVLTATLAMVAGSAAAQIKPYAAFRPAPAPLAVRQPFEPVQTAGAADWPAALSVRTRRFDLDVSPYAAMNAGPRGGLAAAGARIEMSRLSDAGAKAPADQGRWYLFAATSGKAMGLNLLQGARGWDPGGWSAEPNSTLIGDAELGLGWRQGGLQTSLGYRHREGRRKHTMFAQKTQDDSLLAISFVFKPGR